jgi:hypothetical protein
MIKPKSSLKNRYLNNQLVIEQTNTIAIDTRIKIIIKSFKNGTVGRIHTIPPTNNKTVRKYSRNRTWASQDAMRLMRAPKLHQVFIKGISALHLYASKTLFSYSSKGSFQIKGHFQKNQ